MLKNEPEKGLQPHQLAAYRAVRRGFKEKRKASVIMPTGCGKSFVALQTMIDYKDDNILITVPTIVIKNQYYEYIARYIVGEEPTTERTAKMIAVEYFPKLKIVTYAAIERAKPEILKKLNPKAVINDEAHKADAEKTSKKMELLFDSYPNAYWLGITATPERMDGKNVVDHFYEGTIDYELTLEEALRRRIVKEPKYVPCEYALSDKLEDVKKAIEECTNPLKRAKLEEIYEKMRGIVAKAEGIPELIKNNIEIKNGKVVVFCKDKEHMDELMSKVSEWFGQIDNEPEIYNLYSGDGYTTQENIETMRKFKDSKSNHLKILFTIDMLNEGIHMDFDTIIMARPTESKIVYSQQLGRGLSSDDNAKPTTIIDLVNNYLNFDLDRTINQARENETSIISPEDDDRENNDEPDENDEEYIPIECFKIKGEMRKFLDLLEEVNLMNNENRYIRFAKEIHSWVMQHKRFPSASRSGSQEEQDLCAKYFRLKYRYIDKYINMENDDEREQFKKDNPNIDYVIGLMKEVGEYDIPTNLRNVKNILDWMKSQKHPVTPKKRTSDPVELSLCYALYNAKSFTREYKNCKTDEEKRKFEDNHPEIFEVIDKLKEIDEINTPLPICAALDIREWIESQPTPRRPVTSNSKEKNMARKLNSLINFYVSKFNSCKTEDEKQVYINKYPFIIRLNEIIDDINYMCKKEPIKLTQIKQIRDWILEKNTGKRPSTISKNPEESKLGQYYGDINKIVKKYRAFQDELEKKKYEDEHPEIFEIEEIFNWINEHTPSDRLANARKIRKWMELPNHQRFPKRHEKKNGEKKPGFDESNEMQEEHNLAKNLNEIRTHIIKPFLRMNSPEERDEYLKKHTDAVEIFAIINDLDLRFGNTKQRELAELIHKDRDLHDRLQAALAIENKYEIKQNKNVEGEKQEKGADIGEQ